jgi:putative heme iron utilization protein
VTDVAGVAAKARDLLRRTDAGVLSTHSTALPGFPFGSLAPFAMTHEGRPLIYVSRIAEHTRNLKANPRTCLTVIEPTDGNRQALGRTSLVGEAHELPAAERDAAARRYFSFFPEQKAYEDFHDFDFWRIEPQRVRWIGGFGEIHWIDRDAWLLPATEWAAGESAIVDHMNLDHVDAMEAMCRRFLAAEPEGVELVAVAPEGFHLRNAGAIHWLPFAHTCMTSNDVRVEMVRLTREARAA